MKKVFYFNNIFPKYRELQWKLLLKENKYEFNIFFSEKSIDGIRSFDYSKFKNTRNQIHLLKNYFFKKKLFWQSRVLGNISRKNFDIAIFMGDISVLSTWIAILICKLRRKKVFLWTHGIYGNEGYFKKKIRLFFLSLSDEIILYENRAKKILILEGFKIDKLHVIYNSLNYDLQTDLFNQLEKTGVRKKIFNSKLPIIVFIGRLTKQKKIELLIKSVSLINRNKPKVNLLIIGDGFMLEKLKILAKNLIKPENYIFTGELFDENEIANLLYQSNLCVSPGNIGLTAIHSLTYGTPIASHSDFNHQMPEAESIIVGKNGFLFQKDNEIELSEKIVNWINNKQVSKVNVRSIIEKKYNPHFQKKLLDKLILNVKNN